MISVNIYGVSCSLACKEQLSNLILQPPELRNVVMDCGLMSMTQRLLCWGNTASLAKDIKGILRRAACLYLPLLWCASGSPEVLSLKFI